MRIGRMLGNKRIVEMMAKHPVVLSRYSKSKRMAFSVFGWIIIKVMGYPFEEQKRIKTALRLLSPKPGETILEVGCGIGHVSFELSMNYKCNVYGIDVDEDDIILAKKIQNVLRAQNVSFTLTDIQKTKFNDGSFDKVIMIEVIEHIKDDLRALAEISRLLKPQGILVLTTPHSDTPVEFDEPMMDFGAYQVSKEASGHVRNGYSKDGLGNKLRRCGITPLEFFISKSSSLICKGENDAERENRQRRIGI